MSQLWTVHPSDAWQCRASLRREPPVLLTFASPELYPPLSASPFSPPDIARGFWPGCPFLWTRVRTFWFLCATCLLPAPPRYIFTWPPRSLRSKHESGHQKQSFPAVAYCDQRTQRSEVKQVGGGAEGEEQADSTLSMEPDWGLDPMTVTL